MANIINGTNGNDTLYGTTNNDLINGLAGDDKLYSNKSYDILNGDAGNDYLNVFYPSGNTTLNGGTGNDTLNAEDSPGNNNLLLGGDGNDILLTSAATSDSYIGENTLNGGNGNDTFYIKTLFDYATYRGLYNQILTGGGGKDKFVFKRDRSQTGVFTITDFDGIGQNSNPSAAVIAEADTLQFTREHPDIYPPDLFTARNLQLTQNGSNTEISFEKALNLKVVLQNFALENLDNLAQVGNIVFDGQTSIKDSFDVFNANSTQSTIFNKNTVTFLNDLNNNVNGFDNSDDVINGQAGDDIINGKSGNDLLRGGVGNDTLIGGTGDDVLLDDYNRNDLTTNNLLSGDDGNDFLSASSIIINGDLYDGYESGNNTLNGGAGSDTLLADYSTGNNLLSGNDGNDSLSASGYYQIEMGAVKVYGNNTLNGGAGNDTLRADYSTGDNLLSGDDGNDFLSASVVSNVSLEYSSFNSASGNNTLDGGVGNDYLNIDYSKGDNLLFGGNGNDSLFASGYKDDYEDNDASGNNTLNGGAGNDYLNIDYSRGKNLLFGDDGNDFLSAVSASGKNTLDGGNGNDTIKGGNSNDSLYGGDGIDTFVFNNYSEGVDTIYDFNATNELIQLSDNGFDSQLKPSLLDNQFTIGTSATTSNQRLIYDFDTGALYFDLDGSASTFTQVKFAQLSAGLSLTKNNFVVV
ncbi:MAG: calcium-binding protein [Nostoc sp.]|uniref:calcium-binding protein n=1 Tax=Nostoc sp. TaxID=1180 RepID=UPI002FFB66A9